LSTEETPGVSDTTAPVLQSIEANGFWVYLNYNEALKTNSVPDDTDFDIRAISGKTITTIRIEGSRVILVLDATV
jgi:hypothetical protein